MQIIHADIVYSEDREHLASHPDSYIAVENGRVKGIWAVLPEGTDVNECFANEAGVLIEGSDALFVDNAEGFVRLNLAMPRASIEKAMERIEKAIIKSK